jgi:hypothetical protein
MIDHVAIYKSLCERNKKSKLSISEMNEKYWKSASKTGPSISEMNEKYWQYIKKRILG